MREVCQCAATERMRACRQREDIYMQTKVDTRYKVLWIGEIAKHKGIGETKVLRNFSFIEIPVSELKWAN